MRIFTRSVAYEATVNHDAGEDVIFEADCTFDEKDAVKQAGFRFCGGECKGACLRCLMMPVPKKAWWTDKPEIAARLIEHADEQTRQLLTQASQQQAKSQAADTDYQPPAPQGLAYRPFQRAGIDFVLHHVWPRFKGALIGDDMGLGKTVQALGLVNADQSIRRVLILCPKSLQLTWYRHADAWLLPKQEPWFCYVVEETARVPVKANLVICNYDKLVGRPGQVVAPSLVQEKWDLIICDESHYLKNPKAQRTQVALGGLPAAARRLLFLTGTPIENRPAEIHPVAEACAPDEFPFWPFMKRYADAHEEWVGRKKRVWNFKGASHLDELNARLRGTIMVRRLKTDVLKELPPKVRQVVELPRDGAEDELAAEEQAFAPHEDEITAAMALDLAGAGEPGYAGAVSHLTAKVNATFTQLAAARHALGLAKVEPALEWLESALEGGVKKLIVFAHHHDVIDRLVLGLEEHNPVWVDGRVTDTADRQAAVDAFQNDPNVRVFVGQTLAAGVGLTLTAASTVVFVESDWVPGRLTQAEDRAHRIGQTDSVNVYHLVFDRSLDARILQSVLEKQAVLDAALDSTVRVVVEASGASLTGNGSGASAVDDEGKKKWPEATPAERAAALAALRFLAERCDGARKEDGAGFNKIDARIGKELAAKRTPLTDGQVYVAKRMARRYQRQLPEEIRAVLVGGAA